MARIIDESQPVIVEDVSSAEGEDFDVESLDGVVDSITGPAKQITYFS